MLNVHIYVTPICNIRCKHCYYDAGIAVKKEQLLTIEQLKSIVTELYTVYNANFHIEGGELFLRDDINREISYKELLCVFLINDYTNVFAIL